MANVWVTAVGDAISIRSLATPHLLNILRMNVRMARSFVRKAAVLPNVDWRDYVPVIHKALVKIAVKRGMQPATWEDVPEAQAEWVNGADKLLRRRVCGHVEFSADDIEAAKDVVRRAADLMADRTCRGSVDRETGYGFLRVIKNPDDPGTEIGAVIGRSRPVELHDGS